MFMSDRSRGKIVSRAELAKTFGVSLVTIDNWVRRGCPHLDRGANGRQWRFDTAAVARWRDRQKADRPARHERRDPLIETLLSRKDDWREIWAGHDDVPTLSIEEFAAVVQTEPETVLLWVRVGMPYTTAGDIETGEGFRLRVDWAAEWLALVTARFVQAGADRQLLNL
jgi:phage terminase Nu1 subunit (DNA packaging protein)